MRLKHFVIALLVMIFITFEVQAATLKSDLVTNADASPPTMNNPNLDGGTLRRARATYTFTGSEAAADIVEMVKMPKGSIVIRELSTVQYEDMGATIVIEVGDVDDPNRYCSALHAGSASPPGSRITFQEAAGTDTYYLHNVVGTATTNDTVNLTLTTATTPTSGQKVTVEVVYVSGG